MPEEIKRKKLPAKPGKKKKSKRKRSFLRRFLKGVGRVFNIYYSYTTNPEERENHIKPKLFGRAVTFAGFMAMMLALIVLVTLILNNRSVGVEHVNVVMAGLPNDFEGYKILVISDLNGRSFGQDQSTLMRRMGSESYNCVIFLGDMVGPGGNTQPFYSLINQLDGRRPMYFIAGDSDPDPVLSEPRESNGSLTLNEMVLADWVLEAMELGCTYMDVPVKLTRGSSSLWLMPDTFLNLDLYKALDHNPDYYVAPFPFVNDPRNIAKNRHMISINSTMSFNLFGEAAADCIGWKQQSGTGGQGDFVRGAQWSEGGKSIIATSSSFMKNGKRISKIVPYFAPGTAVTTPRSDIHYVATEFGCIDVRALTMQDRARAMISLAHPDFREELTSQAKAVGLI